MKTPKIETYLDNLISNKKLKTDISEDLDLKFILKDMKNQNKKEIAKQNNLFITHYEAALLELKKLAKPITNKMNLDKFNKKQSIPQDLIQQKIAELKHKIKTRRKKQTISTNIIPNKRRAKAPVNIRTKIEATRVEYPHQSLEERLAIVDIATCDLYNEVYIHETRVDQIYIPAEEYISMFIHNRKCVKEYEYMLDGFLLQNRKILADNLDTATSIKEVRDALFYSGWRQKDVATLKYMIHHRKFFSCEEAAIKYFSFDFNKMPKVTFSYEDDKSFLHNFINFCKGLEFCGMNDENRSVVSRYILHSNPKTIKDTFNKFCIT